MADGLVLFGAWVFALLGVSWFALAKPPHFQQARGEPIPKKLRARTLYLRGAASLTLSLTLCLLADHATMASLVWVMLLTAAALVVTFTLAYRPRLLRWLVSGAG